MAEDAQYAPVTDTTTTNKRKYDDQTTPPPPQSGTRRPTGFSAPIVSPDSGHAPPPSYNNAPLAVDDILSAKQRAQEIAARIYNSASSVEAKRPRVENGGGGFDSGDQGHSSVPSDIGQKPLISPSSMPVSYGFQGTSKKIDIPNGRVGVIIGKSGETIKYLQVQSGAKIQVTRDADVVPGSQTRMVELMGTPDQIATAERLISDVLNEAEIGGSGIVSRRVTGQSGAEQFVMKVPNNKVGLIIGKGGETIKNMQARTGARIQVIPLHPPPGDTSTERTLQIDGNSEQIESAKLLVNEVISENRPRNPGMGGGYSQQGYQARPPVNWGPPGGAPTMQQPGYGYQQPGSYPTPATQYNMSQPAYPGYPQSTSGAYPGYDQSGAVQQPQQTTQGGTGYDYYNQQAPTQQQQQQQQAQTGTTAAPDNSGYNYAQQQPTSGYGNQGYTQDGYGYNGPVSQGGYGQQPQAGYDQQQGYNTAPAYANTTNPTPEGHTGAYGAQGDNTSQTPPVQPQPAQGYNTSQQPSPNPNANPASYPSQPGYGMPPTSQPGYGNQAQVYAAGYGQPPQSQKPVYPQTQQSPSTQGGYVQPGPVQPGYPHSQTPPAQTGYAQPDSGSQRAPPVGYGTAAAAAQPGYAPPPYGAPQPGYGQQQAPYSSGYGSGGYAQAPVYGADGSVGSQAVQPGGVAKASPPS